MRGTLFVILITIEYNFHSKVLIQKKTCFSVVWSRRLVDSIYFGKSQEKPSDLGSLHVWICVWVSVCVCDRVEGVLGSLQSSVNNYILCVKQRGHPQKIYIIATILYKSISPRRVFDVWKCSDLHHVDVKIAHSVWIAFAINRAAFLVH